MFSVVNEVKKLYSFSCPLVKSIFQQRHKDSVYEPYPKDLNKDDLDLFLKTTIKRFRKE